MRIEYSSDLSQVQYSNFEDRLSASLHANQNMPRASQRVTIPAMQEAKNLAEAYSDYLDDGDRVLDIGAGEGYFALELASAAKNKNITLKITAVDITPSHLYFDNIRRIYSRDTRSMVKYKEKDISHFQFKDFYAFVNAVAVLPYIAVDKQLRIINKMANHLKANGHAVFDVLIGSSMNQRSLFPLSTEQFQDMLSNLRAKGYNPDVEYSAPFTNIHIARE